MICDWCKALMHSVDIVYTGWYRGKGLVYLCSRPGCGHEVERLAESEVDKWWLRHWWLKRLAFVLDERVGQVEAETMAADWDEAKRRGEI